MTFVRPVRARVPRTVPRTRSMFSATAAACAIAWLTAFAGVTPVSAQEAYDVVIRGGRVMDPETGLDAIRNVGIRGQTVVAITEDELQGETVIDADGLVVAPGFIDMHAHGQTNRANALPGDGRSDDRARAGERGALALPATSVSAPAASVLNYGASVSLGAARTSVMPSYRDGVRGRVRGFRSGGDRGQPPRGGARHGARELRRAATGSSTPTCTTVFARGWRRAPSESGWRTSTTRARLTTRSTGSSSSPVSEGFPIYTHVRSMEISAIQEVLANATATGRTAAHRASEQLQSLWNIETNLDLVRGAQEAGVDVTTEVYPYTAASTSLESAIFDEGMAGTPPGFHVRRPSVAGHRRAPHRGDVLLATVSRAGRSSST